MLFKLETLLFFLARKLRKYNTSKACKRARIKKWTDQQENIYQSALKQIKAAVVKDKLAGVGQGFTKQDSQGFYCAGKECSLIGINIGEEDFRCVRQSKEPKWIIR